MENAPAPVAIRTVPQPTPTSVAQPRGVKLTISVFTVAIIALVISAVTLSIVFTEEDGYHLWVMVMMALVIMIVLLTGIFLPFLKEAKHHR